MNENDMHEIEPAPVVITRAATSQFADAFQIVSEYYDAVSVLAREDGEVFLREYFGENSGIWLAVIDGQVVGCIALRSLSMPRSGEVKRLYVKPDWRKQRAAEKLLGELEHFAAKHAYEWLYLDSKDDLTAALRFYEKHGYEQCPRYNNNPQATIFMRKKLL